MTTLVHDNQAAKSDPTATAQPVTVNVTPIFGDGTICEIEAGNGPSHSFVHGGLIKLHGNPSFQVTWQLLPGDPASLEFDGKNPIWSSQSGCPNGACQDPQIGLVSCTPTTLVINVDPTPPANAVHVSLGWSNGNRWDPIIINN
jgi:hypothetical protein